VYKINHEGNCESKPSGILSLYIPISTAGYIVYGSAVESNVLFAVTQTVAVKCAIALQIINLMGSYVIGFNTVSQAAEAAVNVPPSMEHLIPSALLIYFIELENVLNVDFISQDSLGTGQY